ncbi:MAG: TRAP transporter substrate-binding protein [Saprospiraceae bacterium]|nr:TRAP transporter substrate-binding protein [Saprospiraceae bacterium]
MKVNYLYFTFLLFTTAIILSSCGATSSVKVIKLAHGLDIAHPVHKGMVFMAEELTRISNGQMKMEIYPGEQLGSERQLLELLQIGSVDITKVSASAVENFVPNLRVLGLPYIFRNADHQWKVFNGEIGKELLADGEKYWLRGLCFYDAGSRSFYTKDKPIHKPEDLQGLKIRVMNSQTAIQMIKEMGGAPTPISFGELYTALQQGVVDGAENNAPSFYTSHHYEVCKYYSIDEHTSVPDILFIGTNSWEQLNEQQRAWLEEAVANSVPEQRRLWKEADEEALAEVQKAGVEIIYPDKAPFAEKVADIFESYQDEPELYDLIKRIQAVQ